MLCDCLDTALFGLEPTHQEHQQHRNWSFCMRRMLAGMYARKAPNTAMFHTYQRIPG